RVEDGGLGPAAPLGSGRSSRGLCITSRFPHHGAGRPPTLAGLVIKTGSQNLVITTKMNILHINVALRVSLEKLNSAGVCQQVFFCS
uniref:Uncharacterized protein n=1 Tax=Sparus aurata TaxID=8175 RepID=A0A671W283_SPAAU